jgi:hypothetical protein
VIVGDESKGLHEYVPSIVRDLPQAEDRSARLVVPDASEFRSKSSTDGMPARATWQAIL